jgi:plasmid stabilization system protein ParE
MTLPVIVHPRVGQFLDEAATWWETNRSPDQAERWHIGFVNAIRSLGDSPRSHPIAAESSDFPFELRELHFGLGSRPTHRAIFTIRTDCVYVLLVRHVAQRDISPDDLGLSQD